MRAWPARTRASASTGGRSLTDDAEEEEVVVVVEDVHTDTMP